MLATKVVSLPMRDGNFTTEFGSYRGYYVVSLPMRDGNFHFF